MSDIGNRLAALQAAGVHTIFAQFADIHGSAKGKLVPLTQWDTLAKTGAGFAGPSIWGTGLGRTGPRSEYYGRADADTLQAMPWLPGYARVVLDGFVDAQPFALCPRQILRTQSARLAEQGFTLQAGLEPEFFLLTQDAQGHLHSAPGDNLSKPSYDSQSLLAQRDFLHALGQGLDACGFGVFQYDHEDAGGQYEVNYGYAPALTAADRLLLFKIAAQHLAQERGMIFSMMPKPFAERPGSGLHFHLSLTDASGSERNRLGPGEADWHGQGMSRLGYHFLAGLLQHAPALAAFCAPTVNSYKRLLCADSLSGTSWAPATIAWGDNNRTTVARSVAGRIEWRLPDSSANPYLALAAVIAAGLDGVKRQLDPGAPINQDLYQMSADERRLLGVDLLPQTLGQACDALQADSILRQALGVDFCEQFLMLKRAEWAEYCQQVSAWEVGEYLRKF
ncbi:type III glutamate--ammonia ligase [Massilia sp. W12]|uniref:type III glutamate--ammonia ligase n=1 Tax=Massilia sp. W12 TaxID=3126507 RepID=UPI0030D45127